jgi:radical SAM protein with 4Fe4S-binding SPASM domain
MINKTIDELPKTFCSVPWLQIHTEPDGEITPCCYYNPAHTKDNVLGNWNDGTLIDTFHNEKWNQLRKDFLDGKKPAPCTKCWSEEDSGIVSMRERFNERYARFPDALSQTNANKLEDILKHSEMDGTVDNDLKISTVDLIFNNLCNLKCRSCGTRCSTSWIPDEIKLGRHHFTSNSRLLSNDSENVHTDLEDLVNIIDTYTEVHFSGGEVMMQQDHYDFLKLLIAKGKTDVKIRYNTNLTVYQLKNDNAFELLQKFDNVFIVGSIDAMGVEGEYIRKGFNWEKALEWIKTCKEYLPNKDYGITAVYSLLNCYQAIDLHRHMCENKLFDKFGFYLNTLHNPSYFRTNILPPDVKLEVTEKIQNHLKWLEETQEKNFTYNQSVSHWENAIILMNSQPSDKVMLKKFLHETELLDNIRNEKFSEVFPYMYENITNYVNTI